MRMTKFHSSHQGGLEVVDRGDWAQGFLDVAEACAKDAAVPPLKALGMQYDPRRDVFCFTAPWVKDVTWTKRNMLKTFPQVWDPLGLLQPNTITARMCLSEVARGERDWEDHIRPYKIWLDWVKALENLSDRTSIGRAHV